MIDPLLVAAEIVVALQSIVARSVDPIETVGAERVDGACAPIMASEDFAAFAARVPACFVFVGNGLEAGRGGTPLHSRDYDFNDDILAIGAGFYVNLVHRVLGRRDDAAAG